MKQNNTIKILEISRMAIHNGPGIRTMIHVMGCPMSCIWCSTPESQKAVSQIAYWKEKCTGCGKCISACQSSSIRPDEQNKIVIDRSKCISCFQCSDSCFYGALEAIGRDYTAGELLDEIMRDHVFFQSSGGGVTFSGGEILTSVNDALLEVFTRLKESGISIGIDTCGYASGETIDQVLPFADFFLWDIKGIDDEKHKKNTGVSNQLVIENLKYVLSCKKDVFLRCPLIPGMNDDAEDLRLLAEFCEKLDGIKEVHLLPFHHLGTKRYEKIGLSDPTEQIETTAPDRLEQYKELFMKRGLCVKIVG